jgi:hypothetical protein
MKIDGKSKSVEMALNIYEKKYDFIKNYPISLVSDCLFLTLL